MEPFDQLVPPWADHEGGQLSPDEVAARLDEQVRAAADVARPAAVGLIVAVGNYEWMSGRRSSTVIDLANALMDEFAEPVQSRRWG